MEFYKYFALHNLIIEEDDNLQETLTIEVLGDKNDTWPVKNTSTRNACKTSKRSLTCKSDHNNCTNISFRLGSSLRQITIFTSKLQYIVGDTGNLNFRKYILILHGFKQ